MNNSPSQDIVLRLDEIGQLFNAPDVNPFSDKDVDVLGEAALQRLTRRLLGTRGRNWDGVRMIIELPPDQITPTLQADTVAAVRRYCEAKMEDNRLSARLSRVRGGVGLIIVTVISLIVLGATLLILAGPLSGLNQTFQALIFGSASVFAWVIMWDPLEKLLFDWVPPTLENRILMRLQKMDIAVRAPIGAQA